MAPGTPSPLTQQHTAMDNLVTDKFNAALKAFMQKHGRSDTHLMLAFVNWQYENNTGDAKQERGSPAKNSTIDSPIGKSPAIVNPTTIVPMASPFGQPSQAAQPYPQSSPFQFSPYGPPFVPYFPHAQPAPYGFHSPQHHGFVLQPTPQGSPLNPGTTQGQGSPQQPTMPQNDGGSPLPPHPESPTARMSARRASKALKGGDKNE